MMTEHLIGKSLDNFQITGLLGEGGMGAVYKGQDTTLQRDVAIKVMQPHYARQANFRHRFLIEARATARLDHPNIVRVYHFGQANDWLYIVMEFLAGDNLAQLLDNLREEQQWVALPEAMQLIQQIAQALAYSHRQAVLHRDVKPANIMLKPVSGENLPYVPILTDLGLAKLGRQKAVTQPGVAMGTPAYMSPEQALGEDVNARSDVYSLGVLLFELALGQRPFPISTMSEALRYHVREQPPVPSTLRPDIPEPLTNIILHCLEKEPSNRFASAGELAAALSSISLQTVPTTIPPIANTLSSLKTQHAQSIVLQRNRSVLKQFPTDVEPGQIQILQPSGSVISVDGEQGDIRVGRGEANQIVLNDAKASRHHLRIEREGENSFVTDLKSTNGTYLGNKPLPPQIRTEWHPDQLLRIGQHYLKLNTGSLHTPINENEDNPSSSGNFTASGNSSRSVTNGQTQILVNEETFTVVPGVPTVVPFILVNLTDKVAHFTLHIDGIPDQWFRLPSRVEVKAQSRHSLSFTVQPPRLTSSVAKAYPIQIRANCPQAPQLHSSRDLCLDVKPFVEQNCTLLPQKTRVGQSMTLEIHNQSNVQRTFRVDVGAQPTNARITSEQSEITIAPGDKGTLPLESKSTQTRIFGRAQTHPLLVNVRSAGQQAPAIVKGTVVSHSVVPIWVSPLLLLLLGGTAIFIFQRLPSNTNQPPVSLDTAATVSPEHVQEDSTSSAIFTVTPTQNMSPTTNTRATSKAAASETTSAQATTRAHQKATSFSLTQAANATANQQTSVAQTRSAVTPTPKPSTVTNTPKPPSAPTFTKPAPTATPMRPPTRVSTPTVPHVQRATATRSRSTTNSTQGCFVIENFISAELNFTLTRSDDGWNRTFKVPTKGTQTECFAPGKYTYTIDAPPPWGSTNGELEIGAGENRRWTIGG